MDLNRYPTTLRLRDLPILQSQQLWYALTCEVNIQDPDVLAEQIEGQRELEGGRGFAYATFAGEDEENV